uniref:Uncharacterized protein n=1 Tax=Anguilla anguilla TaxID=7936 RepID=A0A0E9UYE5_ANGAN
MLISTIKRHVLLLLLPTYTASCLSQFICR